MSEAFPQPANSNEAPRTHEEVEQLKAESIEKASDKISELGLPDLVKEATPEELAIAVNELPGIIHELSYTDTGEVANDNRHIVKPLSMYEAKARELKKGYDMPEPFAA